MGEAPSQVHLSSKWPQTPLVKAWRKIYGTYSEHCCRKLLPGAWPPLQSRGSNLSLNWWKATTSNVGSQLRLRPPVLEVDGLVFFCYVNQAILVACPSGSFLGLHWSVQFSSVQSLSHVRLFATPWTTARQASLSITNSQSSPKPMSIESVMPSNHLILCRPLLLLPSIFPSIRVFSNESALRIRWPKYWSFSFNFSPSNEQLVITNWSLLAKAFWLLLHSCCHLW